MGNEVVPWPIFSGVEATAQGFILVNFIDGLFSTYVARYLPVLKKYCSGLSGYLFVSILKIMNTVNVETYHQTLILYNYLFTRRM